MTQQKTKLIFFILIFIFNTKLFSTTRFFPEELLSSSNPSKNGVYLIYRNWYSQKNIQDIGGNLIFLPFKKKERALGISYLYSKRPGINRHNFGIRTIFDLNDVSINFKSSYILSMPNTSPKEQGLSEQLTINIKQKSSFSYQITLFSMITTIKNITKENTHSYISTCIKKTKGNSTFSLGFRELIFQPFQPLFGYSIKYKRLFGSVQFLINPLAIEWELSVPIKQSKIVLALYYTPTAGTAQYCHIFIPLKNKKTKNEKNKTDNTIKKKLSKKTVIALIKQLKLPQYKKEKLIKTVSQLDFSNITSIKNILQALKIDPLFDPILYQRTLNAFQ